MTQITYKTILAAPKPYPIMEKEQYIKFIKKRMDSIHSGEVGIYLGRRIIEKGQELYFPFLDIDGQKLNGDEKIESSISNLSLVWNSLRSLGADKFFKIIATGNTGFRLVSNLLLNHEYYQAFIDFTRCEMPELTDLAPTMDLDMPHQLFVYKGSEYQNRNQLVDGHSALILPDDILNETMCPDLYKTITAGKPDPYEVIDFMEKFFQFTQISDLNVLGEFGKTLHQYVQILKDIEVEPFEYIKFRQDTKPISLNEMKRQLNKKGILCRIEKRGRNVAISFQGLQCPICQKTTSNAVARPPYYNLYCFNTNCAAHNRMSLSKWSGIDNKNKTYVRSNKSNQIPASFKTIDQARKIIKTKLKDPDDALLLVTPGVGKTYVTLKYLAKQKTKKLIIYSCFNKDLQRETYETIKSLSPDHDRFHLLQARDEICRKKRELHEIISMGYSPGELLCPTCEFKNVCEYYKQRENLQTGIYFVSHHMLQYLENRFPKPDLIVLDENLIDGFRLEDDCKELQLRSLSIVLDQKDYSLIDRILTLGKNVSTQMMREKSHPLIINGRKLTPADIMEDSIIGLLSRQKNVSENAIKKDISRIISNINNLPKRYLYQSGVDLNAVTWLQGLIKKDQYSYLLVTTKGECFFKVKYITPLGYRNTPIKILDATGDKKTAQNLLRRKLSLIKSDVEWKSNKTHIKINTSRGMLNFANNSDLKKLLTMMIKQTSADKIMVVTYKFLKETVLKICQEIAPLKDFMDYHFIGPRGINKFKQCEAVIILGLPYSNLNSSGQDAYILFPRDEDQEIRESWTETCMLWELTQNIHRIRPIYKTNVDIIIASSFWPPILDKPDKVIDKSRSKHWKDIAIKKLDPYVKEFGFLNPDIGYIANVFVKSKNKQAEILREKIFDVLCTYFSLKYSTNPNYRYSLLSLLEDCDTDSTIYTDIQTKQISGLIETISRLRDDKKMYVIQILVIYILYNVNLDILNKILLLDHRKLLDSTKSCLSLEASSSNKLLVGSISDTSISLSNNRQWAVLRIYYLEKYPHFETFKIKLPHTRNHYVEGVGDMKQVLKFYQELEMLGIVENIDFDSYVTLDNPSVSIDPLPDKVVVAYFRDDTDDVLHIGFKDDTHTISLGNDIASVNTQFSDIIGSEETTTITNNGKRLAKWILQSGLDQCKIVDILLVEKIISNGQSKKKLDMDFLFNKYEQITDVDSTMCINQMSTVWEKQQKSIDDLDLKNVIELELRIIWITAKLEQTGIEVDVDGMRFYQDWLERESADIKEKIYEILPDNISLTDYDALKMYLNTRYNLTLLNMNKDSLKSVTNQDASKITNLILEYRKCNKEIKDIHRYLDMTGDDNRIHGNIDQLSSVTGRFYHPLQSVIKRGPMRSFFRAKDGYTFVIADYSQLEPRIIAGLSGDIRSSQIFNSDGDIYLEVAKAITGREENECGEFRKVAKTIVLSLNYGRSEYSIYKGLKRIRLSFNLDDIRNFVWRYKQSFSGIFEWRNISVKQAYSSGSVKTVMGRRMFVDQYTKTRSIFNFPVQGSGSDGFKLALYCIDKKLKDLDAEIVHIIHDEVIVEVKTEIADVAADIIKESMEEVFMKLIPNISFKVDPEIRHTWAAA